VTKRHDPESLDEAIRTVAFPIPGARELGLGIPGLVVWQVEGAAAGVRSRVDPGRTFG
jgi:hypothetical protein